MKKLFMYIIVIVMLVNSGLVINAAEATTLNSKTANFNNYESDPAKNQNDVDFTDASKAAVSNAVYQGTSGKSLKLSSGVKGNIYLYTRANGYTEKATDTSIRCLTDAVEFSYYIYFSVFDENGTENIWIDDFTSNTTNPASLRITKAGNVVAGTTGVGM